MSSRGFIPGPLNEEQLRKLVLEAIGRQQDQNPETYHALFGHLERGIQTDDVLFALRGIWRKFRVQKPFNKYFWQWKYRIIASDADDRELLIIIAVDTIRREFEVITRWPENDESA
jgi:hypothetical protein